MPKDETKERIKVMLAYINKEIEVQSTSGKLVAPEPDWFHDKKYRIKPEPKYRPFKNSEECQEEMQKHQPFGWIRSANKHLYSISEVKDDGCIFGDGDGASFSTLFLYKTFLDGTPFGIKE